MASRVRVHYAAIASLFTPAGQIGREAQDVADTIRDEAVFLAPKRTGTLASAIRARRGRGSNQYQTRWEVYVDDDIAPHGRYVVHGTGDMPAGPVRVLYQEPRSPAAAMPSWVEFWNGGRGVMLRNHPLGGQEPNNFLDVALRGGLARHGYL